MIKLVSMIRVPVLIFLDLYLFVTRLGRHGLQAKKWGTITVRVLHLIALLQLTTAFSAFKDIGLSEMVCLKAAVCSLHAARVLGQVSLSPMLEGEGSIPIRDVGFSPLICDTD